MSKRGLRRSGSFISSKWCRWPGISSWRAYVGTSLFQMGFQDCRMYFLLSSSLVRDISDHLGLLCARKTHLTCWWPNLYMVFGNAMYLRQYWAEPKDFFAHFYSEIPDREEDGYAAYCKHFGRRKRYKFTVILSLRNLKPIISLSWNTALTSRQRYVSHIPVKLQHCMKYKGKFYGVSRSNSEETPFYWWLN